MSAAALAHLEGLLVSLPEGHLDRPGVRRAIEVLMYMPGGERAQVPTDAPREVRRAAVAAVLDEHNPRPLLSASPGSPYYQAGLTGRCVCGWAGTTQAATGLDTQAQRGLAARECQQHLAEEILARLV